MRVLAAILIAAVYLRRSHASRVHRPFTAPLQNFVDCTWTLGPAKCFNALGAWRAERAIDADAPNTTYNLIQDLKLFPWNQYRNSSEEQLNLQLCDGTEKLLRRQSLSLTMIPGYRFELLSKGNGTINVDVYKNQMKSTSRGMKKAKKALSSLLPLLALPGLIMAAILPFFLPALKLLTIKAVMLNNMALSGAIFTLLRNNAFNDKYEHKIIYANEGYKNEKHHYHHQFKHHDIHDEHHDFHGEHHGLHDEHHDLHGEHHGLHDEHHDLHGEHYGIPDEHYQINSEPHYQGDSEPNYSNFKPVEYAFDDEINPIHSIPSNSDWNGQVNIQNTYIKRKSKS